MAEDSKRELEAKILGITQEKVEASKSEKREKELREEAETENRTLERERSHLETAIKRTDKERGDLEARIIKLEKERTEIRIDLERQVLVYEIRIDLNFAIEAAGYFLSPSSYCY